MRQEDSNSAERTTNTSFVLRLVVKHPTLSLDQISKGLGLERHHGYEVSEDRKTPTGTKLDGVNKETFWGHSKAFYGTREFFFSAVAMVEPLLRHKPFLDRVNLDGGKVALYVDLFNGTNIGDVLKPRQAQIFSLLGIEMGVEVFP